MNTYINAGIKSKKEAAERLINGEVFFMKAELHEILDELHEIFFDAHQDPCPFRLDNSYLHSSWDNFDQWLIKQDWRDNIGDGVFCWVWDECQSLQSLRLITEYVEGDQYPYINNKCGWMNAKPASLEEIKKYILESR